MKTESYSTDWNNLDLGRAAEIAREAIAKATGNQLV